MAWLAYVTTASPASLSSDHDVACAASVISKLEKKSREQESDEKRAKEEGTKRGERELVDEPEGMDVDNGGRVGVGEVQPQSRGGRNCLNFRQRALNRCQQLDGLARYYSLRRTAGMEAWKEQEPVNGRDGLPSFLMAFGGKDTWTVQGRCSSRFLYRLCHH